MNKKFNQLINALITNIDDTEIVDVVSEDRVILNRKYNDKVDIKIDIEIVNKGTARESYNIKLICNEREVKLIGTNVVGTINLLEDACDNIVKNNKKTNKEYLNEGKDYLLSYLENKGYNLDESVGDVSINEETSVKTKVEVENLDILSFRIDITRKDNETLFRVFSVKKTKTSKVLTMDNLEEELDSLINNYEDFGILTFVIEDKINKAINKKVSKLVSKKGLEIVKENYETYEKLSDTYVLLSNGTDKYKVIVTETPKEDSLKTIVYGVKTIDLVENKNTIEKTNMLIVKEYFTKLDETKYKNIEDANKIIHSLVDNIVKKSENTVKTTELGNNTFYQLITTDKQTYVLHPHLIVNVTNGKEYLNKTDKNLLKDKKVIENEEIGKIMTSLVGKISGIRKEKVSNGNSQRQYKTDTNRMKSLLNYLELSKEDLLTKGISYKLGNTDGDIKDVEVLFTTKKGMNILVNIEEVIYLNKGEEVELFKRKVYTAQTKEMRGSKSFIEGISKLDNSYNEIVKALLTSFNLKNGYHKKK